MWLKTSTFHLIGPTIDSFNLLTHFKIASKDNSLMNRLVAPQNVRVWGICEGINQIGCWTCLLEDSLRELKWTPRPSCDNLFSPLQMKECSCLPDEGHNRAICCSVHLFFVFPTLASFSPPITPWSSLLVLCYSDCDSSLLSKYKQTVRVLLFSIRFIFLPSYRPIRLSTRSIDHLHASLLCFSNVEFIALRHFKLISNEYSLIKTWLFFF